MKDLKKWITTALLSLLLLPAMAQETTGTTYTFRFVPQKDMFYVPWRGNDMELARLLECIESNKTDILDGRLPLYVDGYCNSLNGEKENLAMAKNRSNRVKTEMILRGGLTEACFTTKNHASEGNFVIVRLVIPAGPSEAELAAQRRAAEQAEAERRAAEKRAEEERLAAERAAEEQRKAEEARCAANETETVPPVLEEARDEEPADCAMGLSLRANLLRWATLTPDLGVEWRINSTWAVAVNGSWTSWSWRDMDRRYALWEVMPEVRYYIGEKKAWYVGAMFKTGEFNYKLSETGKQGDLVGGGITAGYQLRLNKALDLDFNLGLGYLNADYEKYEVIDGVRVRRGNDTKNWWGPVNAGVTLVWKLF